MAIYECPRCTHSSIGIPNILATEADASTVLLPDGRTVVTCYHCYWQGPLEQLHVVQCTPSA